jgi:hypothetical protein
MTTRLAYLTEHYQTPDLNRSAYLMALGHPLLRVERQPGGRCVFCFPAAARDDAEGFLRNEPVGAWDFANALRSLKARVRDTD